jgi:malate dehydrogenase
MVRAVIKDEGVAMPVCAWMDGQYGISGVYLGVMATLGANGVEAVSEVALTDEEAAGLAEAAVAVREKVAALEQIDY